MWLCGYVDKFQEFKFRNFKDPKSWVHTWSRIFEFFGSQIYKDNYLQCHLCLSIIYRRLRMPGAVLAQHLLVHLALPCSPLEALILRLVGVHRKIPGSPKIKIIMVLGARDTSRYPEIIEMGVLRFSHKQIAKL